MTLDSTTRLHYEQDLAEATKASTLNMGVEHLTQGIAANTHPTKAKTLKPDNKAYDISFLLAFKVRYIACWGRGLCLRNLLHGGQHSRQHSESSHRGVQDRPPVRCCVECRTGQR